MGIPSLAALLSTPLMPLFSKYLNARIISFLSILLAVIGNLLLAFMTPANHMYIICISFVIMGIGVRVTTILYQTAYEEVSTDKNGIASGIQNSFRQLTACIAIALVSTLSAHFTTIAVDHTKQAFLKEVEQDRVLDESVKSAFLKAYSEKKSSSSFDAKAAKANVHTMLSASQKATTQNMTTLQASTISKSYTLWEQELDKIIDHAQITATNQTYKVYNKCFMISGIVAFIGFFVVPFNRKKKEDTVFISETTAV